MLDEGTSEQAQKVLDMTRERCGELRLATKRLKGNKLKHVEACYASLRSELDSAIKIKLDRNITEIK